MGTKQTLADLVERVGALEKRLDEQPATGPEALEVPELVIPEDVIVTRASSIGDLGPEEFRHWGVSTSLQLVEDGEGRVVISPTGWMNTRVLPILLSSDTIVFAKKF